MVTKRHRFLVENLKDYVTQFVKNVLSLVKMDVHSNRFVIIHLTDYLSLMIANHLQYRHMLAWAVTMSSLISFEKTSIYAKMAWEHEEKYIHYKIGLIASFLLSFFSFSNLSRTYEFKYIFKISFCMVNRFSK